MRAWKFLLYPVASLCLLGGSLPGQEPAAPDRVPGPFRAYVVVDRRFDPQEQRNRTGRLHCSFCEHGLNPMVAVIVRIAPEELQNLPTDAPLVKLLAALEQPAAKYAPYRLGVFTIFLTLEDQYRRDDTRDLVVPLVQNLGRQLDSMRTNNNLDKQRMVLSIAPHTMTQIGADFQPLDRQANPATTALGIRPEDSITVLFINRLKIVKRWTFTAQQPLTDQSIQEVLTTVDKSLARPARKRIR